MSLSLPYDGELEDDGETYVSANATVPKEWHDNKENMTVEEWGQREWESGRKCGYRNGVEAVIKFVQEKAAKCYLNEEDDKAAAYRRLAQDIKHLKDNA